MLCALQFVTVLVIQVMVGFVTPDLVVPHTVGMAVPHTVGLVVLVIKVSAVPVMGGLEGLKKKALVVLQIAGLVVLVMMDTVVLLMMDMVAHAIKVSAVPVMRGLEAEKTALLSAVVAENKWSLQNPVSNTK